jgi:hypothetical protein
MIEDYRQFFVNAYTTTVVIPPQIHVDLKPNIEPPLLVVKISTPEFSGPKTKQAKSKPKPTVVSSETSLAVTNYRQIIEESAPWNH